MRKLQQLTALTSSFIAVALFFSAAHVASAANDTWSSSPSGTVWNSTDWTGGNAPPLPGDALIFNTSSQTTLNNNFSPGTAFDGLYFTGNPFTLNGNNVLISGPYSNTVAVLNFAGQTQTFGTLSLTLDWGYYTFNSPSGPSGNGLALNGGLTLNPGGVAYFDGNNTSTSLTLDANTGLITGLEGAGLMYDGNVTPTGLATISGGAISLFSAYDVSVGSGPIGNGTNIFLSASGAAAAYTANNNTANTITVAQTGNSGGTFTDTLTVTGSLTLGAKGGIYVLGSDTGNKALLSITPATATITAGTSGAATLVFAVNGSTTGNQVGVTSQITNNAGGGAVTVITTGPGSIHFASANSYTGGTYVDQGQLQGDAVGAFGPGPVNIASNATVLVNAAGTWTNNWVISPGPGAPITGTGTLGAGSLYLNNSVTLPGTITLQGAASTVSPGDRIGGNVASITDNFTGQITGTGTLEIDGAHSYTPTLGNTNLVNTNNWQGGLIIGGHPGVNVNVSFKTIAANQIPSGPNRGNVLLIPATSAGYSRFDLDGFNQTINGLSSAGTSQAVAAIASFGTTNCTLTLGGNNAGGTFLGTMSDSGVGKALSLNKIGTGTQTFSGTMTYFGTTTVAAGDLALTGTANPGNSPSFTVASGATLDGSALNAGGLTIGTNQTLNCVGTINGNTTINGTVMALDSIGTLTNNGTLTFNSGGTYIWNINKGTGTQGGDPGWSVLNVQGSLQINSTAGSPFNVDITSLTSGDVPGSTSNFNANANGSWVIATTTGGVNGFSGSSQFKIVTTGFANAPSSSSQWSIAPSGNNLVLTYTAFNLITTPLANATNNAGTTATFTVGSTTGTQPITYSWFQGPNALVSPGTSASGASVTITTNGPGTSSTLTIGGSGVQDADAIGISVNVSDNAGHNASSTASLTVIDAPNSPLITQSVGDGIAAGGVVDLNATANGTQPFTYAWYRNGVLVTNNSSFNGASSGTLSINLSGAEAGNYTVVIGNAAGSVSNSYSLGPVSTVPGQIIYEPFTSYVAQTAGGGQSFDTWEGMTNLFNQLTGSPAWWFHSSGSGIQMVVSPNDLNNGIQNQQGGAYPWPGLAGNSSNMLYWTENLNSHLEFGQTESFPPGTKVYASFVMSLVTPGSANGVADVLAGFTSSDSGTAFNLKFCSLITNFSANQIALGIAKGSGPNAQTVDQNVIWSGPVAVQQDMFIVLCYTVVSGGSTATDDTVSMWINPNPTNFYAGEANVPPPDLGPASFGVTNSVIRDFAVHSTLAPVSHRIADVRIGTTWASVTPPSGPTLSLGNVYAPVGTTATLTSQNAGNPVLNYGWQFNGGSALTDGPTGHGGSSISGSGTYSLTISNVQAGDYGTYTVNGTNIDLSPLDSATNLMGSASGILSGKPPKLSVARSAPNVTVLWPTNWTGFVLEQSPVASPTSWTTNSLPPYAVSGTNNAVVVPATNMQYFRLINP